MEALYWLVEKNPWYAGIEIDEENTLPEDGILFELFLTYRTVRKNCLNYDNYNLVE